MAAPNKSGSEYKDTVQQTSSRSHDDKYGVNAVELLVENADGDALVRLNESGLYNGLTIPDHDYIGLTYVSSGNGTGEIETVTFKTGGASGTTVATLTLGYDGSNRLSTVTKS